MGFVDENKALLRRMYGEIQEPRPATTVRVVKTLREEPRFRRDVEEGTLEDLMEREEREDIQDAHEAGSGRSIRQTDFPSTSSKDGGSAKTDICLSKVEILTPFWASNSNGKVRAILNNQQFQQTIHQELCGKASTPRCSRDCACEQKYKWHRLLAYDPKNDCSGIFMDWFLFPSCCVCRYVLSARLLWGQDITLSYFSRCSKN